MRCPRVTAVPTPFNMDKRNANKGIGSGYPMGYRGHQLPDSHTLKLFPGQLLAVPTGCRPATASEPMSRAWPRHYTSPTATRSTRSWGRRTTAWPSCVLRPAAGPELVEEASLMVREPPPH